MKKTNKNFLYNVVYQIFILIIPLITTPYISRILGVNNIGVYSYTYSIVYYFMLFAMLGINNYGSRTIAKCGDDLNKRSTQFKNIYCLQLILSIVMLVAYFIFMTFLKYDYKMIMIIQGIYILSVAFDINWFFFGIEKFKITISRNIIIKLISLVLIFIFVKTSTDLWKYAAIMSISTLISQIYLWLYLKKYIIKAKIVYKDMIKHLKSCLILFIPVIAYSIYRVMDKTMIGILSNTIELGNYESAEKIINIPISFVMALGTVMIPHMTKVKDTHYTKEIVATFELCFCFIIPMSIGLFMISDNFSLLFFGEEFLKTGNIIKLLVPTIIFSAIANVIRSNYLIPKEKDSIYVKSTIVGAVVNFIINIILIRILGAYGACVGTIIAEFIVTLYQIIKTRVEINYKMVANIFLKYFIKSLAIVVVIILVGLIVKNKMLQLVLQIGLSGIVYFVLNYKFIIYNFLGVKDKSQE